MPPFFIVAGQILAEIRKLRRPNISLTIYKCLFVLNSCPKGGAYDAQLFCGNSHDPKKGLKW